MTDSGRIPALRLNRRERLPRQREAPAVVYDTAHAPGHLRLTRLLVGVVTLAVAWATALLVIVLAESLWDTFPRKYPGVAQLGLSLLAVVGVAWLSLVALALIVVGAFSLALALTRRGW